MIVTAWSNGKFGRTQTTHGLKVKAADRDRYFDQRWKSAVLELEGRPKPVIVHVGKRSFWNAQGKKLR